MSTCTFFGHRDCSAVDKDQLRTILVDLIENHNVDIFYVGNQGAFDALAREVLRDLTQEYPQTQYAVVLAYMPGATTEFDNHSDTMLPEGIESVHPRYAISWRNDWMFKQADYVVTYVAHNWGGAAKYYQKAMKAGKMVINLHDK